MDLEQELVENKELSISEKIIVALIIQTKVLTQESIFEKKPTFDDIKIAKSLVKFLNSISFFSNLFKKYCITETRLQYLFGSRLVSQFKKKNDELENSISLPVFVSINMHIPIDYIDFNLAPFHFSNTEKRYFQIIMCNKTLSELYDSRPSLIDNEMDYLNMDLDFSMFIRSGKLYLQLLDNCNFDQEMSKELQLIKLQK